MKHLTGLLLAGLLACAAGQATQATSPMDADGYVFGTATYYGGSQQFLRNFPARGPPPEYGFGTPLYGSCGYTSQAGTSTVQFSDVPFPLSELSALSNTAFDYPGSCGRCYEIKCMSGMVAANFSSDGQDTEPVNLKNSFMQPGLDYDTLEDDYNRTWAGNPLMDEDLLFTECYNDTMGLTTAANTIYVTVTDNCPCIQYDINTGKEVGVNRPCCGNVNHFDLSYFGFQRLAHPAYGQMNIGYRPVNCETKQPLIYVPGFINSSIYTDSIQAGWSWNAYKTTNKQLEVSGAGVQGQNATCVNADPQGGLTFVSREASQTGYQPFISSNASSVHFYVKQTSTTGNIGQASSAQIPPNVQLSLGQQESQYYCQGIDLTSLSQGSKDSQSGMVQLSSDLSAFNCDLSRVDQIGFQNIGSSPVAFCLSNMELANGTPPSHVATSEAPSPQGSYPGPADPEESSAAT